MPFYLYSVLSPTLFQEITFHMLQMWVHYEVLVKLTFILPLKNLTWVQNKGIRGGGSWNEYHYTDNCLKTEPSPTAIHWSSIPLNKVFRVVKLRKTAFPVSSAVGSWAQSVNLPCACPRALVLPEAQWNHPGILLPTASGAVVPRGDSRQAPILESPTWQSAPCGWDPFVEFSSVLLVGSPGELTRLSVPGVTNPWMNAQGL